MFISASSPDYSLPFKSVGRQNSNLVPELLLGSGFDGDTALLQIRSDSIGVPNVDPDHVTIIHCVQLIRDRDLRHV